MSTSSKLGKAARSGSSRRTTKGSTSRGGVVNDTVRSTVDLPEHVNQTLRIRALEDRTSLQRILEALATAYADGDERAEQLVAEFDPRA